MTRTEVRKKWSLFHNPLVYLDEDDDFEAEWDKIKDETEEVQVPVHDDTGNPVLRLCGEVATSTCRRCNRPWCAEHAVSPRYRCATCEREFAVRASASHKLCTGLGWLAVGCVFAVLGLVWFRWDLALVAAAVGVASTKVMTKLEAVERQRFMAEVHPRF